jgi:hypothetical protein
MYSTRHYRLALLDLANGKNDVTKEFILDILRTMPVMSFSCTTRKPAWFPHNITLSMTKTLTLSVSTSRKPRRLQTWTPC